MTSGYKPLQHIWHFYAHFPGCSPVNWSTPVPILRILRRNSFGESRMPGRRSLTSGTLSVAVVTVESALEVDWLLVELDAVLF